MNEPPDPEWDSETVQTTGSLGRLARSGARLAVSTQLATQVGSILATVVLARLLTPAEFGMIAGVQTIMGATALASTSGLATALVTRTHGAERVASTYFWVALVLGLFISTAIVFLSHPLTSLIGLPSARPLLVVLAVAFPLSLCLQIPLSLLQRRLAFGRLAIAALVPIGILYVTEVVLAFRGLGPWAVIIGQAISTLSALAIALALARWIPRLTFHWRELRHDLGVFGGISLGQAFSYIHKNVDYWSVGRTMGAGPLGHYYIAYVLPNILRLRLSSIFNTVLVPILAKSPDPQTRRNQWRRALLVTLFVGTPLLAGIAAVAAPLVRVFFGDQWTSITSVVQLLMVGSIVDLIIAAVGTIAISERKLARHTALLGLRVVLTTISVIVALNLNPSLTSIAIAVTTASFATLVVQHALVSRPLNISLGPISNDLIFIAGTTALMAACAAGVVHLTGELAPAVQLILGSLTGITVYVGLGMWTRRRRTIEMLKELRRMVGGHT